MTIITQDDFQKARRISRAIQEFLDTTGQRGARTTDVYQYLARKGLIEKDRHEGLHFRNFLKKLKALGMLKLIPQCACTSGKADGNEWHFYSASQVRASLEDINLTNTDHTTQPQFSIIPDQQIDELIKVAKPAVEKLPKRNPDHFTPQELQIRKNYPRVYEHWSNEELSLMKNAFALFKKTDKVAALLERQPHIIEKKLEELGLMA